jgi:hypothetical protein
MRSALDLAEQILDRTGDDDVRSGISSGSSEPPWGALTIRGRFPARYSTYPDVPR